MTFIPVIRTGGTLGSGSYGGAVYGGLTPYLPDFCVEIDVTNDPTNPVRVWTDITPQVRQISYSRSGRQDELQRTETGTLNALLNNRGDAITSLGIRKRQWIRVRGQWDSVIYPRWQGIIEGAPRQWPSAGKDATIQLRAAGIFKILRLKDLEGQTFAAQRNDQRVSAIATLAGITTASIDTDTDTADAIVTPITQGTDALSTLIQIEQSENGLAIEEPDGRLSFQGRHWRMLHSATSLATFGEGVGEIPYRDSMVLEDDDTLLWNEVAVTPSGGVAVIKGDATSQSRYWNSRLNRTLLTSSTSIATDAANYLLNRHKEPTARIPAFDVQLAAAAKKDSTLMPILLGADNSDRFTWKRAATTPLMDAVYVEKISETIAPGTGWDMQFHLSPADDESGWVLGDAVLGVLGTSTRLVY